MKGSSSAVIFCGWLRGSRDAASNNCFILPVGPAPRFLVPLVPTNRTFISGTTLPAQLTPSNNPVINTGNNRLNITVGGQTSVTYDPAGNITHDVNGHSYVYEGENKQTTYEGGASANGGATYSYDGDGRRVKKVVGGSPMTSTVFVYNIQGQLVAEYSDAQPTTAGGTSYLTEDTLGTPRVDTDASGNIKARHDYQPFGEELNAGAGSRTGQNGYLDDSLNQKFTQKERDNETGLDFFEARYYGNTQGRFTSVDPVALTVDRLYDPQKINLYAYCRNNPLSFIDLTGETIDYANKDARKAYEEYEKFLNKDPKKYTSELATLQQLKDSDVNYVIKLDESGTDFSNGKEGKLTSDGKSVFVNIANAGNGTEKFSLNSRFGHELEHARQFDSGEFGFAFDKNGKSIGYVGLDISEEVKAWQVGLKLASAGDFQVKSGSSIPELQFRVLDEFGNAKTDDERAQVLARISDNYKSSYARGGYGTNFTVQGVPPGTLIRPGDRVFNNGTVRLFGRTHKP